MATMKWYMEKASSEGGMAEWFKAAVLKTVERKFRGFESYSLRQIINQITRKFAER